MSIIRFSIVKAYRLLRVSLGLTSWSDFWSYTYSPLNRRNNELRIITILPDAFEADVRIQLSTMAFNAKNAEQYPYEALSYTWGDVTDRATIYVSGTMCFWTLEVTRSCEVALRYLRYPDKPRTVWIDAVCINQADRQERARQVSIMESIYSKALQVVVWLGPAANNSDLAMQLMENLGHRVAVDRSTVQLSWLTEDTEGTDARTVLQSEEELDAYVSLLERSYFERLWVWQEVKMGGDRVKLKCGESETSFSFLMTAVEYYRLKEPAGWRSFGRMVHRHNFLVNIPYHGNYDSLAALNRTRACKCTDQRDRIYTSPAFGDSWADELRLTPDYKCPYQVVFTDFALRYLQVVKDLDFLSYVGDDSHSDNLTRTGDLPSWVPDWSARDRALRLGVGRASAFSASSCVSADRQRLIVRGVLVGTIESATSFGYDLTMELDAVPWFRAIWSGIKTVLPLQPSEEMMAKMAQILSGNNLAEYYVPSRGSCPTIGQFKDFFTRDFSSLTDDANEMFDVEEILILRSISPYCRGRSIFTTGAGHIGLGPNAAQPGDVAAVLLGCGTALILRPTDSNATQYRVIGNALCTYLLHGEAILGPLPEIYEFVQVYEFGSYYPAFRNSQTGEVQYQDPRLPALPDDWTEVPLKLPGRPLLFRNSATREIRDYQHDPRLDDVRTIEDRGVELQEFCLV